jgi:hypothetical protein
MDALVDSSVEPFREFYVSKDPPLCHLIELWID